MPPFPIPLRFFRCSGPYVPRVESSTSRAPCLVDLGDLPSRTGVGSPARPSRPDLRTGGLGSLLFIRRTSYFRHPYHRHRPPVSPPPKRPWSQRRLRRRDFRTTRCPAVWGNPGHGRSPFPIRHTICGSGGGPKGGGVPSEELVSGTKQSQGIGVDSVRRGVGRRSGDRTPRMAPAPVV